MPLPHNLFDYCSIRKSNFIEKYLVVKRKISFVYKADILLTKLIIRGVCYMIDITCCEQIASDFEGSEKCNFL